MSRACLAGWGEVGVELLHQLGRGKHWSVEEGLEAALVLAQWVVRQPELAVDEVEGKDSLLNLIPIIRRLGDQVKEVIIAHNDSLIPDSKPDDEVVLVAVVALEAGPS